MSQKQKSLRRSSSAAGVEQLAPISGPIPGAAGESVPRADDSEDFSAALRRGDSGIAEQVNALHADRIVDEKVFDLAVKGRARGLEMKAALERQEERQQAVRAVVSTSIDDLYSDLSLKSTLQLASPSHSFKWLRRLPAALRVQHPQRNTDAAKEAVIDLCRDCLPSLAKEQDRALKWMDKVAACLTWYEVEGPPRPLQPKTPENSDAWRRVYEWDEAFRSLETLLRQGSVSTFAIVAERFTVKVLGEGMGPFAEQGTDKVRRPSHQHPCAVVCPSFSELRDMLTENHVAFEVAELRDAEPQSAATTALVSRQVKREPSVVLEHDDLRDLRELRRDGEAIVAPEEAGAGLLTTTALWFDGSWRVHALLDVLRQHFLAAPLNVAAKPPQRLPRLVAPALFCNATMRSAEVQSTRTLPAPQTSPSGPSTNHTAELTGYFFPGHVKSLLGYLRVLLPTFSCTLVAADPRGSAGINAFTALGNHRVESVSCERLCAGAGQSADWKWALKLGA